VTRPAISQQPCRQSRPLCAHEQQSRALQHRTLNPTTYSRRTLQPGVLLGAPEPRRTSATSCKGVPAGLPVLTSRAAHTALQLGPPAQMQLIVPQAVSAVFAVMTPEQFAHVNVGTTPAHPNAMCIAETLAVVAGEPHARELVRQLQNQGKAAPHTRQMMLLFPERCFCFPGVIPCCALAAHSFPAAVRLSGRWIPLPYSLPANS
jgi:hypothetical protein